MNKNIYTRISFNVLIISKFCSIAEGLSVNDVHLS